VRWRRSPRSTGRTAARSISRASGRAEKQARRCWSTPRTMPACGASTSRRSIPTS
jgi:hypothetical protein